MDYSARAHSYARRVSSGKIPACRWVRLACERHIADRKRKGWRWRWDKARANRICDFIEALPHVKGRWKSKSIQLEDWQCFMLCSVFGWVDSDGLRRFRTVYVEVPRKNAKTTICAGVGLYLTVADGEPGAEVYSAAVTRDQARISLDIGRRMARKEDEFCSAFGVEVLAHTIVQESSGSFWRPLASDADGLDGLNIHGAIVDELHAHKTREVWDAIDTGTGSRAQPLKWIITTAGSNKEGVCFEQRKYITEVLAGRHDDERYFGIVYGLDLEDDWTQQAAWAKANPNFQVSVLRDDIATLCGQAIQNPQAQNNFKTKRLDVWVSAGTAYFNMLAWDACRHDIAEADFEGRPCWFGLDLASKVDIAAFMRVYERGPGRWVVFGNYYLPEDAIEDGKPNADIYRGWAKEGRLILTPGAITDYEFIERDLIEWAARTNPEQVGYDPYQATELSTRMLAEGLPMIEIPMTVKNLSEPMKAMGAAIITGDFWHDGDPVLGWMFGNVMSKEDAKENVYPTKERRESKIDGAVASMMAFSRGLLAKNSSIPVEVRSVG